MSDDLTKAAMHWGGIRYAVSRDEAKAHLDERAAYHAERVAKYEAEAREEDLKAQAIVDAGDTVSDRIEAKNSSNYNIARDRREAARHKMSEHHRTAKILRGARRTYRPWTCCISTRTKFARWNSWREDRAHV